MKNTLINKEWKTFNSKLNYTKTDVPKIAVDPDRFILLDDEYVEFPNSVSIIMGEKKNNTEKPTILPGPGKFPEVSPMEEPIKPIIYPQEIPIETPLPQAPDMPPYIVPKPEELPI